MGVGVRVRAMAAEEVREWTRDEIVELLEKEAWARRGVDAATLIQSYRDGSLDDPGEVTDLLALAYLLPADDPLSAS
jgi:hypothetical protein